MFKRLMSSLNVLMCSVLIFQLAGCGTIMYPERKGQKSGKIDAGVAILDGIGLLFFFIPGIIAYAVDFSNGTIYLPGGFMSSLEKKDIKEIKFDPQTSNMVSIEKIIKDETGYDVKLSQGDMQIVKLNSFEDMLEQFAKNSQEIRNDQIVLVH